MLKVGLLCGVIVTMSATGLKANLSKKEFESKPIDAQFILELEDDIDSISTDKAIKQQNAVYSRIKNSINRNATQDQNFTILNNAVVVSANKEDIDELRKIPGVKYVTESGTHIVEKSQGSFISVDNVRKNRTGEVEENASAESMHKPSGTNEGEGTVIAVLDNEFYLRAQHTPEDGDDGSSYNHETFTALPSGTKTRLKFSAISSAATHAKTHASQDLGGYIASPGQEGSFYFNNKVPFYFDYAGDSYNGGSNGATPDFNVESKIDLHGSHVASIAAGNADTYKGIAPKAQIVAMKVFADIHKTPASDSARMGEYGRFNEVAFIEALEDCITLGVDAINVSIGSDLSDFEEGTVSQRTLQKISDHGILSAISAGNAGKASYSFTGGYANWTKDLVETGIMGSFANNASTMTVAAGQPKKTFYANAIQIGTSTVPYDDQVVNREGQAPDYPDNEHRLIELINGGIVDPEADGYEPTDAQQETEIDYVYLKGFGEEKDYKGLDVTNKIVAVNRGKINFSTKYENAANHGAKGLIIINNDPTSVDFNFRCDFGDSAKSIEFPIVIALFKDKPVFEGTPNGTFKIRRNKLTDNVLKDTVSDYSTDGSTYNLDLKPEITTPGSNIKGAVWPQNKIEKKEENKYSSYEYFNGTSMAAPNYEGAMALVLSKVAKNGSLADIVEARKSIDMKMMSTAKIMVDYEANDEDGTRSVTSPRMQGAGMVNLEGAYNTDVYLKGRDADGTLLNKSKIMLRNNDDIANGKVKLSFVAHNDSNSAKSFKVSFNVMRPAVAYSNKVLTSDYGAPVEVDSVKSIPGFEFFSPEEEKIIKADGTANYKDVIKVSKDINYYENAEQYNNGEGEPLGVVKEGMYYCATEKAGDPIVWKEVPKSEFQSIKDVEIDKVDCGVVEVAANGDTEINLPEYQINDVHKDIIQSLYENGTYIEGFVTLEAQGSYPSLSLPYMGFYSLSDRVSGASFDSAPVVEPFSFEKDPTKFYGSDLVNDVAKSLLGKDSADMGSMMVTGYADKIDDINTDKILTNDANFMGLKGFYPVATKPDPYASDLTDNPKENIYAGNPEKTNTLIIQQFVYRSVKDNFFTITNKATGEEVYRSALEDCLFGDTAGKYTLYKSHVEGGYLGGGYVSHRAWAIVPLYDIKTRVAFASGEYELKFNYQLAATNNWVSKAYTLHLDAETPVIKTINEFTSEDGKEMVRLTYKDTRCAYAIVGSTKVEVKYDEASKLYYSEVEKSILDAAASSTNETSFSKSRVFIKVVDFARGETTAIVHFDGNYSNYTLVQGTEFSVDHDFKFENGQVSFIVVDANGEEHEFNPVNGFKVSTGSLESAGSGTTKKGFFQKIADFFKKIGDFFRNLFHKK